MNHERPNEGRTAEWLTPPEILKRLGPFDLDPCAPISRPWPTATRHYTKLDDGLSRDWHGFVWVNPPYGRETWKWLERLADHGNGLALIFARTDTVGFVRTVWNRATSILFVHGRPHFHHGDGRRADGNSGGPMALIAYGHEADRRLHANSELGSVLAVAAPRVHQEGGT